MHFSETSLIKECCFEGVALQAASMAFLSQVSTAAVDDLMQEVGITEVDGFKHMLLESHKGALSSWVHSAAV